MQADAPSVTHNAIRNATHATGWTCKTSVLHTLSSAGALRSTSIRMLSLSYRCEVSVYFLAREN